MARQTEVSNAFVESFLSTGEASADEIDRLIRARAPEGAQLEYKGGNWLDGTGESSRGNPSKPVPRLCKWIAGFANSAGGVLIVGLDEAEDDDVPKSVNGETCKAIGASADKVKEFAEKALHSLASQLSPPPQVCVVEHTQGMVLVIGVNRAHQLVPCFEAGGAPVYYVRTYDSTSALTDVVAADLLVGRRVRPVLELQASASRTQPSSSGAVVVTLELKFSNVGLVWIDNLHVSVLFPTTTEHAMRLPTAIRDAVEVAKGGFIARRDAVPGDGYGGPLAPFATAAMHIGIELPAIDGSWCAAVVAASPGNPPIWWEVGGELLEPSDGTPWRATGLVAKASVGARPRIESDS